VNLINLLKYVNFPPGLIRRSVIIKGTAAGNSKHQTFIPFLSLSLSCRDLKSNPSSGPKIGIDEEGVKNWKYLRRQ
jgi:hypothetical protein